MCLTDDIEKTMAMQRNDKFANMRSHNSQFRRHCGLRWQKCNSQKPQSLGAKVCKHAVAALCIRQFCLKEKPNKILALSRELYGSYTVSFSMLPRWAETQKYTHTHTWMLETYILYTANFDASFGMNSCQNGWFFTSFSVAVWAFCLVHGIQRTVCMYKGYGYEFHTMKRRKISSI